jgi:hypothetical protein
MLEVIVFLCNLGYGDDSMGISPMCFSTDQVLEARAFADAQRHSGMKGGILIQDLLDIYANNGKAEELRRMFSMLNANYADERLFSLKDYVLNRWLK